MSLCILNPLERLDVGVFVAYLLPVRKRLCKLRSEHDLGHLLVHFLRILRSSTMTIHGRRSYEIGLRKATSQFFVLTNPKDKKSKKYIVMVCVSSRFRIPSWYESFKKNCLTKVHLIFVTFPAQHPFLLLSLFLYTTTNYYDEAIKAASLNG